MSVTLIVAMDQAHTIGKGDGLPWPRIPEDLRSFAALTRGRPVIVGRRTAPAIPRRADRPIIVLSRSGAGDARTPEEALTRAREASNAKPAVIGGAETYDAFWCVADEAWVTIVDGTHDGDTRFPHDFFSGEWTLVDPPEQLSSIAIACRLARSRPC